MDIALMNWTAVAVGAIAAFGLGMIWFSPLLFGRAWAAGSHGIEPPASPPVAAMILQFLGVVVLALIVGITETDQAIITAIGAILAVALYVSGMDLFSQKSGKAVIVDGGYVIASGVLMILAHAVL